MKHPLPSNKRGELGSTPDIIIAALKGDIKLVSDLLNLGEDVNAIEPGTGNNCLHIAAYHGNEALADMLLIRAGLDLHAINHVDRLRADQIASVFGFHDLCMKIIRARKNSLTPQPRL